MRNWARRAFGLMGKSNTLCASRVSMPRPGCRRRAILRPMLPGSLCLQLEWVGRGYPAVYSGSVVAYGRYDDTTYHKCPIIFLLSTSLLGQGIAYLTCFRCIDYKITMSPREGSKR